MNISCHFNGVMNKLKHTLRDLWKTYDHGYHHQYSRHLCRFQWHPILSVTPHKYVVFGERNLSQFHHDGLWTLSINNCTM